MRLFLSIEKHFSRVSPKAAEMAFAASVLTGFPLTALYTFWMGRPVVAAIPARVRPFSLRSGTKSKGGGSEKELTLQRFYSITMVSWFARTLFPILNGCDRTAADTGHAVGAILPPDGFSVRKPDVV